MICAQSARMTSIHLKNTLEGSGTLWTCSTQRSVSSDCFLVCRQQLNRLDGSFHIITNDLKALNVKPLALHVKPRFQSKVVASSYLDS